MPYDALLRPYLTQQGFGAVVNNALLQAGPVPGASAVVMDFGAAPMEVEAHLRINGPIAGAGTPSLTMKFQESTTGLEATGPWTDIPGAVFAPQTAAMAANPLGAANALDPLRITFRTSKRFVRAFITLAATTDIFNGVTVGILPTMGSRPTTGVS